MELHTIHTQSPLETGDFARNLASQLKEGDILALQGDLATGKTTFTQALAGFFHIPERAGSPTFTLINEYHGDKVLYHFDCYRIKRPEELIELGFYEYLDGGGITIIEWADLIRSLLPSETIWLHFEYGEGENDRIITIHSPNRRFVL